MTDPDFDPTLLGLSLSSSEDEIDTTHGYATSRASKLQQTRAAFEAQKAAFRPVDVRQRLFATLAREDAREEDARQDGGKGDEEEESAMELKMAAEYCFYMREYEKAARIAERALRRVQEEEAVGEERMWERGVEKLGRVEVREVERLVGRCRVKIEEGRREKAGVE